MKSRRLWIREAPGAIPPMSETFLAAAAKPARPEKAAAKERPARRAKAGRG
jgi:hypothetical protein